MKFKIGDRVRVRAGDSTDSRLLNGQIGIIRVVGTSNRKEYVVLDIESQFISPSGIWFDEIKLVETAPKVIEVYGIVAFCNKYYK